MTTPQQPQQPPAPPLSHAPTQTAMAAAPVDHQPPPGPPGQAPGQPPVPQPVPHAMTPPPGQGSGGGYSSPIPITRTHLGHAIASEWTKIRSVRSTMWTLGLMFVLVVGIGLLSAVGRSGETSVSMPMLSSGLFGLMLGQICIMTLGVLVITSEYGTGMIRTTLTACPQRGRVLLAKALIFFLLAFVMTTVACTLTALIHYALLSGPLNMPDYGYSSEDASVRAGEFVTQDGEWLGATLGAGLYVALLGLLSLAVGALLRHSAGAITTMLGVVLLPLVMALFMIGETLETVREKMLEFSPLNGLASLYLIPMQEDQDASGWPLLGLLALVTAAALMGAYALLTRRDV